MGNLFISQQLNVMCGQSLSQPVINHVETLCHLSLIDKWKHDFSALVK